MRVKAQNVAAVFGLTIALATQSCWSHDSTAPKPRVPASIEVVSSATLSGVVGTAVSTRPSIRVFDGAGIRLAGVQVTFAVTIAKGSVSGSSQITSSDGTATVGDWVLDTIAGTNAITATVGGAFA